MKESEKLNFAQNVTVNVDFKNYLSIFNNIVKYIDNNSDNYLKNNNIQLLTQKIELKLNEINTKEIDFSLIKDNLNNTLIQYYLTKDYNNIDIIIILLNYYSKILLNSDKNKFNKWLINDNSEHFNIFELLIETQFSLNKQISLFNNLLSYFNSSDNSLISNILYNRKNNIFHLCVKQNNVPLLLYLYEKIKNFIPSINILDIKNNDGMTSLHLSCFYSLKNVTDNLLLLGCNINEKDKLGNTPLHYAVKGGNIKITKKLVLFGADNSMKNNENLSPKNIARKSPNFTINKILRKSDSIRNKRRDTLLLIMISIFLILKIIIFVKKEKKNHNLLYFIYILSFIFEIICCGIIFYIKIFKKRIYRQINIIKNDYNLLNKQIKFEDIYKLKNYNLDKIEKLCPICKIIKQSKTQHCIICNKCIENWDHHCYWLNICINKEIYNLFISFLIILLIIILFNIIIFLSIILNIRIFNPTLNYINLIIFIFIIGVLIILSCGSFSLIRQFRNINKNRKIEKQRILSLEDVLSNSSDSLSENLNNSIIMNNSNYKDINISKEENLSIEFQELNN